MTPRGAAVVVAALTVAVALGCWWMLESVSIDEPAPAPADFAPSKPRPTIRRRRAPVATTAADAARPVAPAVVGDARLVVYVTADATGDPVAGADVYVADSADHEHAAKTNAAGVARFGALPAGFGQALVQAPGYARGLDRFVEVWSERESECFVALERGVAVTGIVVDENGRPFSGASVMSTDDSDDWLDDSITPIAETLTAADGTFRLTDVRAVRPSFLQFTAPKYSVVTMLWDPATGGRVEARLVRAARVEGRVREPSGRPAADARVKALSSALDQPNHWETTDAEGRFAIDKLPAGVAWSLRAEKDGFIDATPVDVVVRDGEAAAPCELRLRRRPRLEFLVLDGAGAPVDAAEVDVKDASGRFEPKQCVKGRATFDVAEAGACRVAIDAPRFLPHEETVVAAVDETTQVVVRLDAGAALAGVVVDDADAPVANAEIEVLGGFLAGFGAWTRTTTSGADGSFRVEGLTPGDHPMNVAASGLVARKERASAPASGMRIVLRRGARLTIRLRAPADAGPLGAVEYSCLSDDGGDAAGSGQRVARKSQKDWSGATWSDELDVVAGTWRVRAQVAGFLPATRAVEIAAGETVAVEFDLDRGLSISGVVVDDVGRPVAGAHVTLRDADRPQAADTAADGAFRFDALPWSVAAATVVASRDLGDTASVHVPVLPVETLRVVLRRNGNVSFRVRGVAGASVAGLSIRVDNFEVADAPTSGDVRLSLVPGARAILARAPRHAPAELVVDVAPGCDLRLPDVVLDAGAAIVGRVVDASERPIAGAQVEAGFEATESDSDGRFSMQGFVRKDTVVRVAAHGFRTSYVEWRPTLSTPLVVVMRRGALVRGQVRDVFGAPVHDVDVTVVDLDRPDAGKQDEPSVFRDGSFTSRLPEGRWRIALRRDGKQVATRDVELHEGDETSVDLVVAK